MSERSPDNLSPQIEPEGPSPTSPLGHRLMFLMLACLAFCVFAPTVLLPIIRDHGELLAEEHRLGEQIADLDREVARLEELAYAFENDAVINERLAVLDLRYKRPDEVIVSVLSDTAMIPQEPVAHQALAVQSALRMPPDWPRWAKRAEAWADSRGLISLFLDPALRPIFLLMSCGLLIAAFVLFAPRIGRLPAEPDPAEDHAETLPAC